MASIARTGVPHSMKEETNFGGFTFPKVSILRFIYFMSMESFFYFRKVWYLLPCWIFIMIRNTGTIQKSSSQRGFTMQRQTLTFQMRGYLKRFSKKFLSKTNTKFFIIAYSFSDWKEVLLGPIFGWKRILLVLCWPDAKLWVSSSDWKNIWFAWNG